jgi:hypothetical protein
VRAYAHAAGQHLGPAYERVAENLHDGYQQAGKYVQRNPGQAIAMAFGAGGFTRVESRLLRWPHSYFASLVIWRINLAS